MSSEAHLYAEHYRMPLEMLNEVLADMSMALHPSDVACITEFLEHNELGEAFHFLIAVISKEQLGVTRDMYKKIVQIGTKIDLDPKNWENIQIA